MPEAPQYNYKTVQVTFEDGIAWVTLNRPEKRNAVSAEMATRRVDEVSPISDDGLPTEVMPLINELNQLFGRVRGGRNRHASHCPRAARHPAGHEHECEHVGRVTAAGRLALS